MADIGVHVQQTAERCRFKQAAHFLHRRLVAAFMPDAEHAFGLGAGRKNSLGARGAERQRLFTEHLLAGGKRGDHHFFVQQMRRHHRDGIDAGPREQRLVVVDESEFVGRRERRRHLDVDVAAGHDFEPRAFREASDDLLAPPAEPDNTYPDHAASFPWLFAPNNAGVAANAQWHGAPVRHRPNSLWIPVGFCGIAATADCKYRWVTFFK